MKELNFTKKQLKINMYDGSVVLIDYPSLGKYDKFLSENKKIQEQDNIKFMLKLLKFLGMTKEQAESLEPEHCGMIVDEILGQNVKK